MGFSIKLNIVLGQKKYIKKLNDYELAIEQPYYKNLFSFLNGD